MNIFMLASNPKINARYHCNRHVVKMVTEYAQIMSTVVNELASKQLYYRTTHKHHPCVLWAGKSLANFRRLYRLCEALNAEYRYRFKRSRDHAAWSKVKGILPVATRLFVRNQLILSRSTRPALAMPDYCKIGGTVASYREYYKKEKQHLFKWTGRSIPGFLRGVVDEQ